MRLVVSDRTPDGRAKFSSDGPAPVLTIDGVSREHIDIWGSDRFGDIVTAADQPAFHTFFPPPGGYRVMVLTMLPDTETLPEDEITRWEAKYPGLHSNTSTAGFDPDVPGMHWTPTVDIGYLIEGEVELELDGETTVLHAGDWFVQNAARHAWHNRTDTPCKMAVFVVGLTDGK